MGDLREAPRDVITKFTNCRLVRDNALVQADLWVSSLSGKIIDGQEVFYSQQRLPDVVVDLGNRIVSPGLIDVQLNGAFGVNFSDVPEDLESFPKLLKDVNKQLIRTGVTSYLPTVTSQNSEVYHKVWLYLQVLPLRYLRGETDTNSSYHISAHPAAHGGQKQARNPSAPILKGPSSRPPRTGFTMWRSSAPRRMASKT